jgi:hypothetical protein
MSRSSQRCRNSWADAPSGRAERGHLLQKKTDGDWMIWARHSSIPLLARDKIVAKVPLHQSARREEEGRCGVRGRFTSPGAGSRAPLSREDIRR